MWDKLGDTHEGTNQVKETKIDMLVDEYDLFEMKDDQKHWRDVQMLLQNCPYS